MIAIQNITSKGLNTAFSIAAELTATVVYSHQAAAATYNEATGTATANLIAMNATGMFFTLTEKDAPGQVRIGDQRILIRASELANLTARGPTVDDYIELADGTRFEVFFFSLDPSKQMFIFFGHKRAP